MSRIGKNTIEIPSDITVKVDGNLLTVSGANGELTQEIRPEIKVILDDNLLKFEVQNEAQGANAFWGLARALVNNMIIGVTKGFEKDLELTGVGYRVKSQGKDSISLTVGYSHPVEFKAPEGVELIVEGNTEIKVKGADKQLVGLTAARIKKIRKPEPYKGKGIRYKGEYIKLKPGKAAKTAA